jgi:tripartite-type tricarboxylate transporter receptor subunit TctC
VGSARQLRHLWCFSTGSARTVLCLLALAAIAACHSSGAAANYPSRQLTYLIAFDPGGQSDREARRQQPLLQQYLQQPVVVDYKVGGSGALGWSEAAHSRPDGYQFVGINLPQIILQPMLQDTGFETHQLRPIVFFQRTPIALAVLNTSPYATLDAFLRAAREHPGTLSIGGSGTLTGPHLSTIRLDKQAGSRTRYVPFTGSSPAITAFLGGHTSANFIFSDEVIRFRDRIRVLAITSETRLPGFEDAPTFRELGFDLVEAVERGVGVPRGTPDAIVAKLESVFLRVANDPAIRLAQQRDGFVPLVMGSADAEAHIRVRTEHYRQMLQALDH